MRRAAYCIRLFNTDYNDEDGPARYQVDWDDERGNAWSSRVEDKREIDNWITNGPVTSLGLGNWHLPVVDVDVPRTDAIEAIIEEVFPGAQWVKSTNNWHVYSDVPIKWDDYCGRMAVLVRCGVVEEGFYGAMLSRGASFVRMPHVKKEDASDE